MNKNESIENAITKICLSDIIEHNFEAVGFKETENKEVIRYFLQKNIKAIFGKDTFDSYEMEIDSIIENEIDTSQEQFALKKVNKLKINYGDVEYTISSEKGQVLKMGVPNSSIMFRITAEENANHNFLVFSDNEDLIHEYQTVGLEENPYFDYKKIIYNTNAAKTEMTPTYRAKSMESRRGYASLFQIIDVEKSTKNFAWNTLLTLDIKMMMIALREYLEKLKSESEIVGLTFLEEPFDVYKHLEEIFYMLEKKGERKDRKRIRKQ